MKWWWKANASISPRPGAVPRGASARRLGIRQLYRHAHRGHAHAAAARQTRRRGPLSRHGARSGLPLRGQNVNIAFVEAIFLWQATALVLALALVTLLVFFSRQAHASEKLI